MASSRETPQERRDRYLKLAAESEINAARLSEPKAKAAAIDLAVSWMLMAAKTFLRRPSPQLSRPRLCALGAKFSLDLVGQLRPGFRDGEIGIAQLGVFTRKGQVHSFSRAIAIAIHLLVRVTRMRAHVS